MDESYTIIKTESEDSEWSRNYGELSQFVEKYDRLPTISDGDMVKWIVEQRIAYRNCELQKDRIEQLEKIKHWCWPQVKDWMSKYHILKKFISDNRRLPLTTFNERQLYKWIEYQKISYARDILSPNKINLLEKLPNWSWSSAKNYMKNWMVKYEKLRDFIEKNGKLPGLKSPEKDLYIWFHYQRKLYKNGTLEQSKLDLLNDIDIWNWSHEKNVWYQNYNKLKIYYSEHGKLPSEGHPIFKWLSEQKSLSKYQCKKLRDIGVLEWMNGCSRIQGVKRKKRR